MLMMDPGVHSLTRSASTTLISMRPAHSQRGHSTMPVVTAPRSKVDKPITKSHLGHTWALSHERPDAEMSSPLLIVNSRWHVLHGGSTAKEPRDCAQTMHQTHKVCHLINTIITYL
jgi:hypothetical protein